MNWFKKIARYFPVNQDGDSEALDETLLDHYDALDQADNVFTGTGIHVDRSKQISQVVMPDNEDKVIGALADGWTRSEEDGNIVNEYSFDLSVLKNYQKQGIGRQMIADAINKYNNEKEAYSGQGEYTRIKIRAVNPHIARILENEYKFDCDPVAYKNGEPVECFCYKY